MSLFSDRSLTTPPSKVNSRPGNKISHSRNSALTFWINQLITEPCLSRSCSPGVNVSLITSSRMCAPVWTDSAVGSWSTYRSSGTPCARTRVHFWSHSDESAPQGGAGLVLQPGHCSANIWQSLLTSLMYLVLWRAVRLIFIATLEPKATSASSYVVLSSPEGSTERKEAVFCHFKVLVSIHVQMFQYIVSTQFSRSSTQ